VNKLSRSPLIFAVFVASGFALKAAEFAVRVSDSGSRKPIDGVTVTLSRQPGEDLAAETDSPGRAAFAELPPGSWRLHVEKASYLDLLDPARM